MNHISRTMDSFEDPKHLLHQVKFGILLALQIPAIILSVLIFAFFLTSRPALRSLQNQALLLLFIVNFIQLAVTLPMAMQFFHLGRVIPATAAFCTWWTYMEYTLNISSQFIVAIMSLQRHLLVFQPNLLRRRLTLWLLYYLPLLLGVVYPAAFFMYTNVIYRCDGTQWDYMSNLCGDAACYLLYDPILSLCDWIVNTMIPMAVILLASLALIVRVLWQKYSRHQAISWSKQRRLTLQLLSISGLYLIAWLPNTIVSLIQTYYSPDFLSAVFGDYIADCVYLVCLFLPWVCLGLLPDFKKWIWMKYQGRAQLRNAVVSII